MEHFFPQYFYLLGKESEALILGLLKRGRLWGSVGSGTGKRGEGTVNDLHKSTPQRHPPALGLVS